MKNDRFSFYPVPVLELYTRRTLNNGKVAKTYSARKIRWIEEAALELLGERSTQELTGESRRADHF